MKTFKDLQERDYSLVITFASVKSVKAKLGIDLLDVYDSNPLVGSRQKPIDIVSIVDVVYVLCLKDCERHELNDEGFAEAMGAAQMQAAVESFYAEWQDFFQGLNRPDAAKVIQKSRDLLLAAVTAAEAKLSTINPQQIIDKILGGGAAELQVPQGSATAT